MAYSTGDAILDDHYNGFATSVNALWGSGSGDSGYGNTTTTVAAVDTSTTVQATQWNTLFARTTSMASHQNTSITSVSDVSTGDVIRAIAAVSTNIAAITTNKLNVHARQSVSQATNQDNTDNFTGTLTFTFKWAWGSANQARYFFNLGGRLNISGTQTGHGSDTKGNEWANLLTAAGTYQVLAQTSGKSGGSGSADTNSTNSGYHDLTATYATAFKQFEDSSPYTSSFVQWQLRTQDSGASVETSCTWVDAAADNTGFNKSIYNVQDIVEGTHRMTFSLEKHDTTHIADNGGSVTVTGTNSHSSDIRLKTNIEKLDVVEGLQTYSWNYKNYPDGGKFTGVMAQDLLGTQYENALLTDANGYYKVDYNKLPVDCNKIN